METLPTPGVALASAAAGPDPIEKNFNASRDCSSCSFLEYYKGILVANAN